MCDVFLSFIVAYYHNKEAVLPDAMPLFNSQMERMVNQEPV